MGSKTLIGDLSSTDKLDGTNYDIWHRKIQYLLNEREVLETLTTTATKPKDPKHENYDEEMQTYLEWSKRERSARYTMLYCMHNDLIGEFESCSNAQEMWNRLKITYGQTSATRLRALNLKWMQYSEDPKHTMAEHLCVMGALIRDLKTAGREVSDEEQILGVIRSLPDEPEHWRNFKALMTHSDNIKTFQDISRHLEMEDVRLLAAGPSKTASANVAHVVKRKAKHPKQNNKAKGKRPSKGPKNGEIRKHQNGKSQKKNVAHMTCYNCRKKGHLAR